MSRDHDDSLLSLSSSVCVPAARLWWEGLQRCRHGVCASGAWFPLCTRLSLHKGRSKTTSPIIHINSRCLSSDPFYVERSKKPPLCTGCQVRNGFWNNGWVQELITMCLQNSELLTDHCAKILAKTVSVGMWWTSFMFLLLSIVGDHSDFGKNHTMTDLFSLRTRFWLIVYAVRQQVLRFTSHY